MAWKKNRPLLVFTGCLAFLCALGGWHFLADGIATGPTLVILTPHGDNIRQEIGAAFQAWHLARFGAAPELVWVDQGGTSEDLRYVEARYAKTPAGIGIDLFFGGGTPPFRTLARDTLLVPHALSPAVWAGIPATLAGSRILSDAEGWYGSALSGFGILYNKTLLAEKNLPPPDSWEALADPRCAGWVAMIDPRGSGSAHVIYEIILQRYGWEAGWRLLTGMAANSEHFTKGASAVLPLISAGESAYTVAIDQYAWSLVEKLGSDKVGFVLPPGASVTTPDPIAMLKGAPHPEAARRFMEFVLSEPCQRLWVLKAGVPGGPKAQSLNRMSVRPSVAARLDTAISFVRGDPFSEADSMAWRYSDSLTESRWALVNDALGLWLVDNHAAARGSRAVAPDGPLFRPPGTWEEMRALNGNWKDDAFRNRTVGAWAARLGQATR